MLGAESARSNRGRVNKIIPTPENASFTMANVLDNMFGVWLARNQRSKMIMSLFGFDRCEGGIRNHIGPLGIPKNEKGGNQSEDQTRLCKKGHSLSVPQSPATGARGGICSLPPEPSISCLISCNPSTCATRSIASASRRRSGMGTVKIILYAIID